MKKTHAVSVNYRTEDGTSEGVTFGPYTHEHALDLAAWIEGSYTSDYTSRESVVVTRHTPYTVYTDTTRGPWRVARDIHPRLWLDEDDLILAREVASATGCTVEDALIDQRLMFTDHSEHVAYGVGLEDYLAWDTMVDA